MSKPYSTMSGHLYHAGQVCIVMVGLPGRGKTNLSERICRFLTWLGVRTKVFHLSNYRRELLGLDYDITADYFTPTNADRKSVVEKCLNDVIDYFVKEQGQVTIYDAVNATSKERREIYNLAKENNVECLFVESLVTDEKVLARNIAEVRMTSPDYVGKDPKKSIEHYLKHIEARLQSYETVNEEDFCCIKLVNDAEHCIVQNGPLGYLLNRVLMFLLNSRRRVGSLFFARVGASDTEQYTETHGDTDLNARGRMYAQTLANTLMGYISSKQVDWNDVKVDIAQLTKVADQKSHMYVSALPSAAPSANPSRRNSMSKSSTNLLRELSLSREPPTPLTSSHQTSTASHIHGARTPSVTVTPTESPLVVWTSTRRTAVQTARPLREAGVPVSNNSLLNQLNAGDAAPYFNNHEELKKNFPEEFEGFMKDTYHYRFPRGESYQDVAVRLEPLIMGIEREQTNLLIVGHESVLRVLYGYIMGLQSEDIPKLHFPPDHIVEIVPHGYSNLVVNIPLVGVSLDGGVNLPEGVIEV